MLANPTPPLPPLPEWDAAAERPTLAFAGRLTAPKDLGVALAAVAACDGVTLRLAGEGDERAALEARAAELGLDSRVEFLGALGRDEVLALFRGADAAILSSAWENFPHTVVEALAVGTPVIATAVGGVPEIVRDGENGLLVPPGDPAALAAAIRRFFAEPELRARLALGRGALRRALRARARLRRARADPRGGGPVKRVLMVGRTRYRLPLEPSLARKFDALRAVLELRVLASAPAGAPAGDDTFTLVPPVSPRALDGARLPRSRCPFRVARELRAFRPDAVAHPEPARGGRRACSGGALAAQPRPDRRRAPRRLAHGDPPLRLAGAARCSARSPTGSARAALRRADAVRTVSPYTTGLAREVGVEPAATFPAFMDLEPFLGERREPLPERPRRSSSACSSATRTSTASPRPGGSWPPALPGAQLRIVGDGSLRGGRRGARAEHPERALGRRTSPPAEVAAALDAATVLVLPSRSEGMGRVLVEAFCRGRGRGRRRASAGSATSSRTARAASSSSPAPRRRSPTRSCACSRDRALAERLGEGAAAAAGAWLQTPEQYAERVRALVDGLAG